MSKTGYVYTLVDPRTGEPRYVGATKYPKRRLSGHKSGATNEDVKSWIEELESEGFEPEMFVVDVTDMNNLSESELSTIQRLAEEFELLNRKMRGYTNTGRLADVEATTKTLTLSLEVAERLEQENNQSKAATEALREYYEL